MPRLLMGDVRTNDWVELDNNLAAIQLWADEINAALSESAANLASGVGGLVSLVVPTGAGFVWYAATAPAGYLLCDGAEVSRVTYAALFALWGVTWGAGNSSTTFNLPDLRQRLPLGKAASGTGATLAGTFGSIDHTHTGPSHTHTGGSHTHGSGSYDVSGNTDTAALDTSEVQSGTGIFVTNDGVHSHGSSGLGITGTSGSGGTGATSADGTGATGTGNPPCLVVNWIVKT